MNFDKTDSIIFDMDGTLWDAVDSYCKVWDYCSDEMGITKKITRDKLIGYMGKTLDVIFAEIFGKEINFNPKKYIKRLDEVEALLMPTLGGIPYPHMKEGIKKLSEHYKIFLVSNCGQSGLRTFMEYTGITPYITDSRTFGETMIPKSENITALIEQYSLKAPIYMGDTQGDCNETRKAGIPFIFAEYGFGSCENPDLSFKSFKKFSDYFLSIKIH